MEAVWSRGAGKTLYNPLKQVYCFHGEDDHQKDDAIVVLRAVAIDESFSDFDFEVIEAGARTADDILASANLAPFSSTVRLVVVRGAELYRKRERSGDAERLATGLAALGSGSCVALRVAAAEDERSRGKTVLSAKLDAAIREAGALVQCRALSDEDLAEWIVAEAARAGKRVAGQTAQRIVAIGRGSRTAMANELEKVLCYAGDETVITLPMVEATGSYDPEDVMFKLVDSICRRNADLALRNFHEILRYDPKPQAVAGRLLALLARQLRLIAQAIELSALRIDSSSLRTLSPDIAAELPSDGSLTGMAWKARDIYAQARAWNRHEVATAFECMLECDLNNKGGGDGSEDVVTNIELLIIRLCDRSRR